MIMLGWGGDTFDNVGVELGLPSVALNPKCQSSSAPQTELRRTPSFTLNPTSGFRAKDGGAEGIRTPDPHNAIVVLYQLSYDPIRRSTSELEFRGPKSNVKENISPGREWRDRPVAHPTCCV